MLNFLYVEKKMERNNEDGAAANRSNATTLDRTVRFRLPLNENQRVMQVVLPVGELFLFFFAANVSSFFQCEESHIFLLLHTFLEISARTISKRLSSCKCHKCF